MADNIPGDLKYTREHEWARAQGNVVVVGVTDHAQTSLGDVVYVELPKVGAKVTAGASVGTIESTKAVSELFSPLSGTVVKVNDSLTDNPSQVNDDPYGAGWLVEIEPSDPKQVDGLLDAAAYAELVKNA
ncbi:glycine cleavage system protein GcvH [Myxococcus sp. Y35]|uniref:glycine cleavage system protein GcvH n=1 Tax=Pseudomyxococcus flavus TaxID=3115648 RepID=UPI003CEF8A2B